MADLRDGESVEMKGSGSRPYVLKNVGGVYSCSCPAWRNQSVGIERRTCKHLRKLRSEEAEAARVGSALPAQPAPDAVEKTAPPLLLAESWDGSVSLGGWWMSEKLDGVRAYWTGDKFLSRLGNPFHAPDWFIAGLPTSPLDGELWIDRKAFQRTVGIVRRQDKTDLWNQVRFLIFDAPESGGGFEQRLGEVERLVRATQPPYARALEHIQCADADHLRRELARVEALGGEGLMLRQPGSQYEAGRSSTLLIARAVKALPASAAQTTNGHSPTPAAAFANSSPNDRVTVSDVIGEAVGVAALLRDAGSRVAKLVGALRRQRNQTRAVQQAVRSLKDLSIH